jgi:hypothetical protein
LITRWEDEDKGETDDEAEKTEDRDCEGLDEETVDEEEMELKVGTGFFFKRDDDDELLGCERDKRLLAIRLELGSSNADLLVVMSLFDEEDGKEGEEELEEEEEEEALVFETMEVPSDLVVLRSGDVPMIALLDKEARDVSGES